MSWLEDVVFSDEMSGNRMQRKTEEGTEKKVSHCFSAKEIEHQGIEGQGEQKIDHF